jgi:hypothetical protein
VKQGHAWAYRQYADNADYCIWENAARSIRRGLWATDEWIAPWEWRAWQRDHDAKVTDYRSESVQSWLREFNAAYLRRSIL